MTLGDFVLVFLLGGVIILSTVGSDRSLTNCTCAAITVGLLHRVVSWAKTRSLRLGAVIDGTPVVLVKQGEWQDEVAGGMYVQRADLDAAARLKGVKTAEDVDFAIIERNGGISVIEREDESK